MLAATLCGVGIGFTLAHLSQNASATAASYLSPLTPITSGSFETAKTHCDRSEQVVFSCVVQKSAKVLSICTSKQLDGQNGYVQYRFGQPGKIELEFPADRKDSQRQFGYNRYTRPLVTYLALRFESNGYKYSIHQDSSAEEKPPVNAAYLTVTPPEPEAKPTETTCRQPVIGSLMLLEDVVPRSEGTDILGP
jgi:hypothetical protein